MFASIGKVMFVQVARENLTNRIQTNNARMVNVAWFAHAFALKDFVGGIFWGAIRITV